MRENFVEQFIDLGDGCLGAQGITELALNHGECCLDIGALVVMDEERLAVEIIEVEQPPPQRKTFAGGVNLDQDVRDRPGCCYRCQVLVADVTLVRRNLDGPKTLRLALTPELMRTY